MSRLHEMEKTRLSSKGQVVLPKNVRRARGWEPGTEFSVEATQDGVILRPLASFEPTELEDVFGCLERDGPARTLDDMDEAIVKEARRRRAGDRY